MKNLLIVATFMTFGMPAVFSAEAVEHSQLTEAINTVSGAEKNLQNAGTIQVDCVNCQTLGPDKKLELKNKIEDLDRPFIYKDNVPYVIQLKRTKDSPLKTTLKFKNGHSVCGRVFMGTNPYNGSLIVDCLYRTTAYEDEELDLNFKQLPIPAVGEEQIIQLKIIKPNVSNSYYAVEAEVLKGPATKVESDKKFWGSGFNLDFNSKEEGKP